MAGSLRASWRALAATPRLDLVLVAVVIILAESEIWLPPNQCVPRSYPFGFCNFGESLGPRPVEIAYTTLVALLLLGRRARPMLVLCLIGGLSIAKALIWVGSPGLGYFLPLLFASYSVGRHHRGSHPWLVLAAAGMIVLVTAAVHDLRVPGETPSGTLATFYVVALGALPMGRALQVKDLRAELSEAQARQAEIMRDETARRAVAEERGRIARELHDVVAHGVSMIVVQSVAAQGVLDRAPDRARAALEAIEHSAREGLDEMRRLLAVLQPGAESGPLEPAPGVDALRSLVERVAAAGQPVELHLEGVSRRLSPGLELTIYRVAQEALTNAVKHARGAATVLRLRLGEEHVDLVVRNGPGRRDEATGSGRGLVGMRERVALYGGDFEAGPTPEGGFRVQVRLPTAPQR